MPGLLLIHTVIALLSSCDVLTLDPSQRVTPPDLLRDERPALPHLIQELVRSRRHVIQELVRVQPHLVHDMGRPEVQEISRSQPQMKVVANSSGANQPSAASESQGEARPSAAATAMDDNMDVEDEMERMVHLVSPQDSERYIGQTDLSQEASGFYGTDMEDRDRGEEGGDERARRGGEEEWERDTGEDRERRGGDREGEADNEDASELGHLTPDLDTLIGYSPSAHPPSSVQPDLSSPAQIHETGPQEHHASPVLEREPWETEGEEDVLSSGYGLVHSSVTTTTTATSAAPSTSPSTLSAEVAGGVEVVDTAAPETDSNAGLWTSFTSKDENSRKEDEELTGVSRQNPTEPDVGMVPSKEPLQPAVEEDEEAGEEDLDVRKFGLEDSSEGEEDEKWRKTESDGTRTQHLVPLTADSSLTASFNDSSSDWLDKSTPIQTKRSKVGGSRLKTQEMKEAQQVVCLDWKELVGRGYVILNMTQNLNCEEFRADQGVRLLKIMEHVFARRMNSPEGSWVLYLSKPTHQQHQLHMNVASESGVIATSDVLDMLGEIRKSLNKVGIQNYSATSRCHSQPSQTRSDYGKLFVVLVIIGSICMVIITSGFIYICWQRRLPATKTMFRAEELHFVENGCHDNPMLDVTNDSQPEMQEKKPSTNGLAGAGDRGKEDSSRWQVFVNQAAAEEEEEEQDTHL